VVQQKCSCQTTRAVYLPTDKLRMTISICRIQKFSKGWAWSLEMFSVSYVENLGFHGEERVWHTCRPPWVRYTSTLDSPFLPKQLSDNFVVRHCANPEIYTSISRCLIIVALSYQDYCKVHWGTNSGRILRKGEFLDDDRATQWMTLKWHCQAVPDFCDGNREGYR